jgi:hypothetical protein
METKDNYTFNNIDKKVLDENIGEQAIRACNDEKLMKRLMVSSLGECISLLDEIDKSVNVINALIGTIYAKDLEEYFRVVAKNVRKAEKEEKQRQEQEKKNIENVDNIN